MHPAGVLLKMKLKINREHVVVKSGLLVLNSPQAKARYNSDAESGQTSGSYSTDLTAANGHLDNNFNATKVDKTLHTQVAAETAAQTAVELGLQA